MDVQICIAGQIGAGTPPDTVEELVLDTVKFVGHKVGGLDTYVNLQVLTLNGWLRPRLAGGLSDADQADAARAVRQSTQRDT